MASLICCQRSGCAVCWVVVRPCAVMPGGSAVEGDDPVGPGGLVAFDGGALLESIFGSASPGALVEPGAVVLTAAVASLSLVVALAIESSGMAGAGFMDTVSCAGARGSGTASFGGSGAGVGAGVVEPGTSLVAMRPGNSLGNSMR